MAQTYKVQAPARADLGGGTLDLWPLYCFVGGARTINVALDLFATAEVIAEPASAFELEMIASIDDSVALLTGPLDEKALMSLAPTIRFPAAIASAWMAGKDKLPQVRAKIRCSSMVPPRSGLGGSSTLAVAVARALGRLTLDYTDSGWQFSLLHWVKDVEAKFLTMLTGTQDYLAAIFGGVNSFEYKYGSLQRSAYPDVVLNELADRTLILYSGEVHDSGSSNWEIVRSVVEQKGDSLSGLSEIAGIAEALHSELTKPQVDWKAAGALVTSEWAVRRRLFNVHTKRLDEILQFLAKQGVLGAKVCGAAGGGSLIAIVDPLRREEIAELCRAGGIQSLNTRCTKQGVTIS